MMQTEQLLNNLTHFRATANDETFRRIFGESLGDHLWREYKKLNFDLIKFYRKLDLQNMRLFAAAFEPKGSFYIEATCAECGQALSSEDVEAEEEICLECGAALLLDPEGDDPLVAEIWVGSSQ